MGRAATVRRTSLLDRLAVMSEALLDAPALVAAPHPDDETLGCGGLLLARHARGVPASVVFLTDGAGSHQGGSSGPGLAERRKAEGAEACRRLGAAPPEFLNFPDGALHEHVEAALPH